MKKILIMAVVVLVGLVLLVFVARTWLFGSDSEVGDVSLGLLTARDIKIEHFNDPKLPGVTCYVAHVQGNFDISDKGNSSISCRQTGDITLAQLQTIDLSNSGAVVFSASKSLFFKTMKIRRIYDKRSRSLLYLSYSTTEVSGDYEHSLSTVPLYGNPVWEQVGVLFPEQRQ